MPNNDDDLTPVAELERRKRRQQELQDQIDGEVRRYGTSVGEENAVTSFQKGFFKGDYDRAVKKKR